MIAPIQTAAAISSKLVPKMSMDIYGPLYVYERMRLSVPPLETLPLSPALIAELRSDHAGEAGAVSIYRGILAVSRDAAVREFACEHIRTEERHLRFFNDWLPARYRSRLLPVWKAAGWLLGAASALFGRRVVFLSIDAVETFVESHYQRQIVAIAGIPELAVLGAKLSSFCDDEVGHRDDARRRREGPPGFIARALGHIIGVSSVIGVAIARRV